MQIGFKSTPTQCANTRFKNRESTKANHKEPEYLKPFSTDKDAYEDAKRLAVKYYGKNVPVGIFELKEKGDRFVVAGKYYNDIIYNNKINNKAGNSVDNSTHHLFNIHKEF